MLLKKLSLVISPYSLQKQDPDYNFAGIKAWIHLPEWYRNGRKEDNLIQTAKSDNASIANLSCSFDLVWVVMLCLLSIYSAR